MFLPSWLEKEIQYSHWLCSPPQFSATNTTCFTSTTMSQAWSDWTNAPFDTLSLNPAHWFEETKILVYSWPFSSFPNIFISWSTLILLLLQYTFLKEKYTLFLSMYLKASTHVKSRWMRSVTEFISSISDECNSYLQLHNIPLFSK